MLVAHLEHGEMKVIQRRRALRDNVRQIPKPTIDALGERDIADRIFAAVMERRLPPGTKLAENVLSETFGASRARIRRVLLILAEREIVKLESNRGAFVARPTPGDARHVFQARCTIEPTIVRNAVQFISDSQIRSLKSQVKQEAEANHSGNRHEAIRLSGSFHVRLAEFAGNPVLQRFIEDLVARSSLIIGLFGSPRVSFCSQDEHSGLISAIEKRNPATAPVLMLEHLNRIERELELNGPIDGPVDLRKILRA